MRCTRDGPPSGVESIEDATTTISEAESALVERARAGDADAYGAIVRLYHDVACRIAYLVLGDAAEAEDAAQEAFIKAFYALPRFRPGAPFRPWLLEIVANQARNQRRAAGRRDALALRATAGASKDAAPSPEADVLVEEQRQAVLRAVGGLREDDRLVVAYRYFQELSEAEIAAALGCARGTVKSRLSRALERLRRPLALALLALLVLTAAVLAVSPTAREAVAERLGLRGVKITQIGSNATLVPLSTADTVVPPSAMATLVSSRYTAPPLVPLGARLDLGRSLTLDAARARVGFTVELPAALGTPDAVYLLDTPPGGQVALVYRPRADLPAASTTGVGLLLTEFQGSLPSGGPALKGLPPGTRIEDVVVGGSHGYWIDGDPHLFGFQDATGHAEMETTRLAANVLLWEDGLLTLRLESALDRDAALSIASSTR